jgi:LysR family transcriptional regulator, nitrogen assimilation regulatory protein
MAIARSGSVSAAAEVLHVAQPSLSQHVQRVEEELGVTLLVRSARGVTLTENGQRLLGHADAIVKRLDLAIADMRNLSQEVSGPVSVGFPSVVSNVLAVPFAETIRHEFPQVTLRVMEAMSGHVQAWLLDGSVDIAILYDVNDLRHLTVHPLLVESLSLIAAKDNWPHDIGPDGIAVEPIHFCKCANLDLILPNRTHGLRETIERFARAQAFSLQVPLEIDSLVQIKRLVARGSGFTILPHVAVVDDLADGSLVSIPIIQPIVRNTVYLVTDPQRQQTRAGKYVQETVRTVVKELVRRQIWHGELCYEALR